MPVRPAEAEGAWAVDFRLVPEEIACVRSAGIVSRTGRDSRVIKKNVQNVERKWRADKI